MWHEAAGHGESPEEQALGQSCSVRRGDSKGAGGLGELSPMGNLCCNNSVLKNGLCGTGPYDNNILRTTVCEKPT